MCTCALARITNRSTITTIRSRSSRIFSKRSSIAARPTWRSIGWTDAKATYMNLFNHARPLADQLLVLMQKWLESHRVAANGVRAADIDSFDKWLQERDGIAKATASIPH